MVSVALVVALLATTPAAKTLSLPHFQLELPDGWEQSVELNSGGNEHSVATVHHPNGAGTLQVGCYEAPAVVSMEVLRNFTNVESSISLPWQSWGDYAGYQYSYAEGSNYYRQWWLANERIIIFITYQSDAEPRHAEIEAVNRIVRSITVPDPRG